MMNETQSEVLHVSKFPLVLHAKQPINIDISSHPELCNTGIKICADTDTLPPIQMSEF